MYSKEIVNFAIQKKLEHLAFNVNYYKTAFLPDIYEHSGRSQAEHLESAKERLEAFKLDVQDYRKSEHFQYLELTERDMANYIRMYAIEQREQAQDYSENHFIKWRCLRNCVAALNKLKEMLPELSIYSNHWLAGRNQITLKN